MKRFYKLFTLFLLSLLIGNCTLKTEECPAQWIQTNGPAGGNAYCLLTAGSAYLAGTLSGIYRSTDNGQAWYQVQSEMNNQKVESLMMYGSTVYAGGYFGIYTSTDNGLTWTHNAYNGADVTAMAVSGSNIFAGTWGSGVLKSTDNGQTWAQTELSAAGITAMFVSGSYIFAGSGSDSIGVFRSSNNGVNWTKCYYAEGWPVIAMAKNSTSLFAATISTYYMGRVLRSTDNGQTWVITSLTGHKEYSLTTNGNDIYAGTYGEGIYRSTNNGDNWSGPLLGSNTIWSLSFLGTNLFAGTRNFGIYYTSNNGTNWTQALHTNATILSLAASSSKIYAGTSDDLGYGNGIFSSSNGGANWTLIGQSSHAIFGLAISGSNLLAGTDNGIMLSSNEGTNWTQVYGNTLLVTSMASGGAYVYAGLSTLGLCRSTNNGLTWSGTSVNQDVIRAITVNGSTVFASTDSYGIYRSTNNGANWTQASGPAGALALAVSGTNVFAGNYLGVFVSTDNGNTWTYPSMSMNVYSLAASGSNIFAGTLNYGVYVTKDNGANWILKDEGLGLQGYNALLVYSNYLYAGMQYSSVWKRSIQEMIGIKQISELVPTAYSLSQNYPNPFNPSTNISYAIPKTGFVKLVVFDMLGREIETIVNEKQNAGIYEVSFNGTGFTSGVYFYRLTAEGYSDTKRMVLIK